MAIAAAVSKTFSKRIGRSNENWTGEAWKPSIVLLF
jgi:hypothetical protein